MFNAVFGEYRLLYFHKLAEWPILLSVLFELFLRVIGWSVILEFRFGSYSFASYWIIRFLLFIYLGWLFSYHEKKKWFHAALLGAYAGIVVGFIVGLFEFVWYRNLGGFLQMLAVPWQLMALGGITVTLVSNFLKEWRKERKHVLQRSNNK